MENTNQITFGDFSTSETDKIRALAETFNKKSEDPRSRSTSDSCDSFQFEFEADPNEVDLFLSWSPTTNLNNNADKNQEDEIVNSTTQVASSFETARSTSTDFETQPIPDPKEQRKIVKANKKRLQQVSKTQLSNSMANFLNTPNISSQKSDSNLLNTAMMLTPSQSTRASLPKLNEKPSSASNLFNNFNKDASTSVGSSIEKDFYFSQPESVQMDIETQSNCDETRQTNTLTIPRITTEITYSNNPSVESIIPNTQDKTEAGGSSDPRFTMKGIDLTTRPHLRIAGLHEPPKRGIVSSSSPNKRTAHQSTDVSKNIFDISTDFTVPQVPFESRRVPIREATPPQTNENLDFEITNLLEQYNTESRSLDLQTRLDVKVFPPALTLWRQLRNLQSRRIILDLRVSYNKKLLQTEHYPDWSVNFLPPLSLLNSERAIDLVIQYRTTTSRESIRILIELMKEESLRLSHEINVTQNSFRLHYDHPDATSYDIREALHALNIFARRTKETELGELTRKYNAIHLAPTSALWKGLPESVRLPPSAVKPNTTPRSPIPNNNNTQVFRDPGPGTRRQGQGRAPRGNRRGRGRGNTQGSSRPFNRGQGRRTIKQVMDFLSTMMQ